MTDCCNWCGKTSSMNCKRCKTVAYCSDDCQRRDWKAHKLECKRKDIAGSPCDVCHRTEVDIQDLCLECGFLFCEECDEDNLTRDGAGEIVSFEPCPRCQQRRCFRNGQSRKKLETLVRKNSDDPRMAEWLVKLGAIYLDYDSERWENKAKETFLRAGDLGYGEGYSRVAEIYAQHRNWEEAKRYVQKAAKLYHVIAIGNLATEAMLGYFHFGDIVQEDRRRTPDVEEAVRLFREGARLGHPGCCAHLGLCYLKGIGVEENHAKAFKWSKLGAERGDVEGMQQCGECFLYGKGVEQSNEQARFWLEKSLEEDDDDDDDDEDALAMLRTLRDL